MSVEEAKEWANKKNFFFMEVSAKENKDDCVGKGFMELFKEILKEMEGERVETN